MGYRVRSVDGELHFEGIYEVEKAWMQGLVGPDDEIIEDGKEKGVKASQHPQLTRRPERRAGAPAARTVRVLALVMLGVAALVVWNAHAWSLYVRAGAVGVLGVVMALMLTGLSRDAFPRRR